MMEDADQQAVDELIKDFVPQLSLDQAQMVRSNLPLNKSAEAAESSGFSCSHVLYSGSWF